MLSFLPCPSPPDLCSTTAGKRGKGKKSGGRADKPLVVVTELPYQTNKVGTAAQLPANLPPIWQWPSNQAADHHSCPPNPFEPHPTPHPPPHPLALQAALVEQIARLVDAGTLSGVSDVRDESDRDGMRVVVELKRGGWIRADAIREPAVCGAC